MSDETYLAFAPPGARSDATSLGESLDRISVRDYLREVEIGAFQAERGVKQRIRFNVVLEVSHHAAAQTDDVDQVLSYDTIIEAIDAQLSNERINLLETLAERVAERVLSNRKAVRVFVRIEKLDRIPGTLGVEIVRSRIEGANVVRPVDDAPKVSDEAVHPLVIFLPNKVLHSDRLGDWLDAIASHKTPAIICLEAAIEAAPKARVAAAGWRIELLSIEQNAWVLAGRDKRCVVVDSRTELDWAMKHGQLSVWAPSRIVLDAVDGPLQVSPIDLANWFAAEFSADELVVLEGFDKAAGLHVISTPSGL
ncbi:MAG: dihydroneopterin aldolase [Alphaproteobacteria bacterium]|nr:dihydroneopterin aldolase [Alphaproteobacteria bacterium]